MKNSFGHSIALLLKGKPGDDQKNLSQEGIEKIIADASFLNKQLEHHPEVTGFQLLIPKMNRIDQKIPTIEEQCATLFTENIIVQPEEFSKEDWLKTGYEDPLIVAKKLQAISAKQPLVVAIVSQNLLETVVTKMLVVLTRTTNEQDPLVKKVIQQVRSKLSKTVIINFESGQTLRGIFHY